MIPKSRNVFCILGVPIDAVSLNEAVSVVTNAIERRTKCFLSTPNVHFLLQSQTDESFRRSLINSDLVVADGMPLIWLARLLKIPLPQRVSGSDLFEKLRTLPSRRPIRVFFFGGNPGIAQRASEKLGAGAGGMCSVGFEYPGFGAANELGDPDTIGHINASAADLLVVALGAAKGQAWIDAHRHELNVPVVCHLGAVINFVAGTVRRAPRWMQQLGLEWCWRISQEPSLWRRYLQDGVWLLGLILGRVFPDALNIRWSKPSEAELAAATVFIDDSATARRVRLTGAWCRHNLSGRRKYLVDTVNGKDRIELDLSEVTHLDSALIGTIFLMEKLQSDAGGSLSIVNASRIARRTIHWNCADYLFNKSAI